jgi:hypothetical protein
MKRQKVSKKRWSLLLLFLIAAIHTFAQQSTNSGTHFFVAFGRNDKGGLFTSSYDFNKCWQVQYGKVDKAFTLFLKKKATGTTILASDLGLYLAYLPKREPYWGIDVLNVGYKYGSGSNIYIGGGVFMNYFNTDMFAFRWTSTVKTDIVADITQTTALLNGSFERSRFNPAQDTVTLIDNPHFTPSVALPNTLLGWDTISRYGFIYSEIGNHRYGWSIYY